MYCQAGKQTLSFELKRVELLRMEKSVRELMEGSCFCFLFAETVAHLETLSECCSCRNTQSRNAGSEHQRFVECRWQNRGSNLFRATSERCTQRSVNEYSRLPVVMFIVISWGVLVIFLNNKVNCEINLLLFPNKKEKE